MNNLIKTNPTLEFKNHLEESDKVFFSGVYGIGKTTYLRNRFNKEDGDLSTHYIVFHLFPVNYSVADNKDVFELIKYDLLYQLIDHFDLDELKDDNTLYKSKLAEFISENYIKLFYKFLTSIPQIGGSIEKIKSNLEVIIQDFKNLKDSNKLKKIQSFVDEFSLTKGSIYEEDFYTELIISLIEKLKEKEPNKKIILIIDDLDRIDPNHIFRILNIFSAHIDSQNENSKNKFNIDKVIVVGDYYNIKSIFHHVYGEKTDFKGFMDKYYTHRIYELSFHEKLSDILYQKFLNKDTYMLKLLKLILVILFENKKLNLRQLSKLDGLISKYSDLNYSKIKEILINLYGNDKQSLKKCIIECEKIIQFEKIYLSENYFYLDVLVGDHFDLNFNDFKQISNNPEKYKYILSKKEISLTALTQSRKKDITVDRESVDELNIIDFWELFSKTINN